LKKCSSEFYIKPESLVELVKLQQEKLVKSLEKGLIPDNIYVPKKRAVDQLTKKKKQPSRIFKMEEPKTYVSLVRKLQSTRHFDLFIFKSEQDEELQMAIAMSNSISSTENKVLQLVKVKKSNKNQAFLQIYDKQDRERVLGERLSAILDRQIKFDLVNSDSSSNFLVKTKYDNRANYLWNKCRYFAQQSESFYVDIFVNNSSFRVGGQLFAVKEDQVRSIYFPYCRRHFEILINLLAKHSLSETTSSNFIRPQFPTTTRR
jgi:hypothetical protein